MFIREKKYRHYFASLSAVPTFRNLVQILVDREKLVPEVLKSTKETKSISIYTPKTPSKKTSIKSLSESKKKDEEPKEKTKEAQSESSTQIKKAPKPLNPVEKKSANELFKDMF